MSVGVVWGLVVTALALLAWGGQAHSWLAPSVAERRSLTERASSVEPVFHADVRAEAAWDTLTLWTMVVAGVLLVTGVEAWAYFGLIGGGTYSYFAGRGIASRVEMRRRGFRVGAEANVRAAYVLLVTWAVMAVITMVGAVAALASTD